VSEDGPRRFVGQEAEAQTSRVLNHDINHLSLQERYCIDFTALIYTYCQAREIAEEVWMRGILNCGAPL